MLPSHFILCPSCRLFVTDFMSTPVQIIFLEQKIMEREEENRHFHETLDFLTRKLYGTKSEKTSVLGIEGQKWFKVIDYYVKTFECRQAEKPSTNHWFDGFFHFFILLKKYERMMWHDYCKRRKGFR